MFTQFLHATTTTENVCFKGHTFREKADVAIVGGRVDKCKKEKKSNGLEQLVASKHSMYV